MGLKYAPLFFMATLQDKVTGYIGTFADTSSLSSWLTESAHMLIDLLSVQTLELYSTDLSDTGTGIAVIGNRILRSHKLGYEAPMLHAGLKTQFGDSSSMYYATSTSPISYLENGNGYILPGGGTFIVFAYPVLLFSTITLSTQFLTDYEDLIIIPVAIKAETQNINSLITIVKALSFSTQTGQTFDFSSELTQAATYIDTDEDIELAQGKISEIQSRLANVTELIRNSEMLISQEDKRLMDTINLNIQSIQSMLNHLKEMQSQYQLLLKVAIQ